MMRDKKTLKVITLIFLFLISLACSWYDASPVGLLDCIERASEDLESELRDATNFSISISTDVDSFSGPDEEINYLFEVTNTGQAAIRHAINITDSLLAITCEGGPSGGRITYHTDNCFEEQYDWLQIHNSVGDSFWPGESFTCRASYITTTDDVANGEVENLTSGRINISYGITFPTSNPLNWDSRHVLDVDFAIKKGPVTHVVPLIGSPAISLAKSASEQFYSGGETVTYEYVITNTGNALLEGPFNISDDRIAFVACPSGITLAPGEALSCSASVTMDMGLRWTITNTAQASTTFNGQTVLSNFASASIEYRQPEEDDPEPCPYAPGDCD